MSKNWICDSKAVSTGPSRRKHLASRSLFWPWKSQILAYLHKLRIQCIGRSPWSCVKFLELQLSPRESYRLLTGQPHPPSFRIWPLATKTSSKSLKQTQKWPISTFTAPAAAAYYSSRKSRVKNSRSTLHLDSFNTATAPLETCLTHTGSDLAQ